MPNYNHIEKEIEKKWSAKDKRKRKRMNVSGKSVFKIAEIIKKQARHSL